MELVSVLVYLMYLSLGIELLIFSVPSVASSFNLWSKKNDFQNEMENADIKIAEWSFIKKVFFLALPVVIICLTFLLPILYASGILDVPSKYYWIENPGLNKWFCVLPFLIMAIGRLLSFYSVLRIRQENKQTGHSFDLKMTSIYNKSRNPIQLGMYVFALGLILLYPSPIFFFGIIFYILYMDYKIRIEEKFLLEKFGDAYAKYSSETKRYF
jgi:protein-S-isoprenylcysteine O-methyltransferase Ste14